MSEKEPRIVSGTPEYRSEKPDEINPTVEGEVAHAEQDLVRAEGLIVGYRADFSDGEKVELIKPTGNKEIDRQIRVLNKYGISSSDFNDILGFDYITMPDDFTTTIKYLQEMVGMPKSQRDGVIGPQTIDALYAYVKKHGATAPDNSGFEFPKMAKRIYAIQRVYAQLHAHDARKDVA